MIFLRERVMLVGQSAELKTCRNHAIKAARDLCYGIDVIDRIKEAKTEPEIDRIMKSARHKYLKDDWERG